jgi:hypothetical protein
LRVIKRSVSGLTTPCGLLSSGGGDMQGWPICRRLILEKRDLGVKRKGCRKRSLESGQAARVSFLFILAQSLGWFTSEASILTTDPQDCCIFRHLQVYMSHTFLKY